MTREDIIGLLKEYIVALEKNAELKGQKINLLEDELTETNATIEQYSDMIDRYSSEIDRYESAIEAVEDALVGLDG